MLSVHLPRVGPTTLQWQGFWSVPHWKQTKGMGRQSIVILRLSVRANRFSGKETNARDIQEAQRREASRAYSFYAATTEIYVLSLSSVDIFGYLDVLDPPDLHVNDVCKWLPCFQSYALSLFRSPTH